MDIQNKRCTFAIISHPDAGKTTITEKLIWFGEVIRNTGMVNSKRGQFTKSDWMDIEKERGISVTSSVLSFPYKDRAMHLLDTPGHKDFSEDTYRTLTAVESVLMMIDSAKGVEEQTIKLMEVCRLRDTPIVTFFNKFDRDSLGPFELIDNLESILSIHCVPLSWPIGQGADFKGVYDILTKEIRLFPDTQKNTQDKSKNIFYDPHSPKIINASNLDAPELIELIGEELQIQLKEDLSMVEELIGDFQMDEYLAGIQTPVFFGSALYNFGVKETIDFIANNAPGPENRPARLFPFGSNDPIREVSPGEATFSGFIFKIQANMDKKHRDRVAFLRVTSGKFERGQKIFHVRSEKELKISSPLIFSANEREVTAFALPGDIIGIHDSGKFQIGDTFTEGEKIQFTGIPRFSPEIFKKITLKDPMKAKQLDKGLKQLSEEGTVQLFIRHHGREKILGAVGALQFEVVKARLEDEYGVRGEFENFPFIGIRWPKFKNQKDRESFIKNNSINICYDHKNRVCYSVKSEWDLKLLIEKNPEIGFFKNSDFL